MHTKQFFKGHHGVSSFILGFLLIFIGIVSVGSIAVISVEILGSDFFGTAFSNHLIFVAQMLPFLGGMVALFFVVRGVHKISFSQFLTTRPHFDWKRILFSFIICFIFLVLLFAVDYLTAEEGAYMFIFNVKTFFFQVLLSIFLISIQSAFEEMLFRGYLLQALGMLFRRRYLAWIFSSILFGLMHYANPEVSEMGNIFLLEYVFVGLFLGLIVLMDGGLELAIGFHIANNIFASLMVSAEWSALQTDTIFSYTKAISMTDMLVSPFLCLLLILIFQKKYQWKRWQVLLFGKISPE